MDGVITLCQVCVLFYFYTLFLINSFSSVCSQPFDYPSANLSTSWINNPSAPHSVNFRDGSAVTAILLKGTFGPKFACGFYCNGNCDSYLFAIFIVQTNSASMITSPSIGFPQVVWSANRNSPVQVNATLQLTSDGDLVLRDVDGSLAWSSNTSGKSVAGLNLTDGGNLILFDENQAIVWQSFDHPTDSLVLGQSLLAGQKLTASVSDTNSTEAGLYFLLVTNQSLSAYIQSDPPQAYYQNSMSGLKPNQEPSYVKYLNGSLALYLNSAEPNQSTLSISITQASSAAAQYMKLGPDGHLRVYEWVAQWKEADDVLTGYLGDCAYPMVCGQYSICRNGQCSCPGPSNGTTSYFTQIDQTQPNLGCSEVTPLTCGASQLNRFEELDNVTYFTFNSSIDNTDADSCKKSCLNDCNCKAAIFRYGSDPANGECYLPNDIFSLMTNDMAQTHYNSSAFLKVQISPSALSPSDGSPSPLQKSKKKNPFANVFGKVLGAAALPVLIIALTIFKCCKKRKGNDDEEDYLDQVPGMPTRFSHEELRIATDNFSTKLGEGGFGSVFEGTLKDGTKIAVKCLEGLGQVKKSFLAEVESIGSIHHVNLVRLIGFCADKSNRLLVYEFMSNGSLDKWIYHKDQVLISPLDWKSRRKIILDIAKGLAYLHEDCRQKIIHLDIKPQNILLDENYNAKVSDFGLSKLIDRDQSQVVTTMRGTPGYLAPEWLTSGITEKVDVYSFGVVVLETLCGRKNFDLTQAEESMHLLTLFQKRAGEGKLLELVDQYNQDMQVHREEVVEIMKLAAWCLQSDFVKRPSMSVVVKVLDGVMPIVQDMYSTFSDLALLEPVAEVYTDCTPLTASVLSGPR